MGQVLLAGRVNSTGHMQEGRSLLEVRREISTYHHTMLLTLIHALQSGGFLTLNRFGRSTLALVRQNTYIEGAKQPTRCLHLLCRGHVTPRKRDRVAGSAGHIPPHLLNYNLEKANTKS